MATELKVRTIWWKKPKKGGSTVYQTYILTVNSYIKAVDEGKQENFARDVEKTFDKDSEEQ